MLTPNDIRGNILFSCWSVYHYSIQWRPTRDSLQKLQNSRQPAYLLAESCTYCNIVVPAFISQASERCRDSGWTMHGIRSEVPQLSVLPNPAARLHITVSVDYPKTAIGMGADRAHVHHLSKHRQGTARVCDATSPKVCMDFGHIDLFHAVFSTPQSVQ